MTHTVNFVLTNLTTGSFSRSESNTITGISKVHMKECRRAVYSGKETERRFHATSANPFVICVISESTRKIDDGEIVNFKEVRIYESVVADEAPINSLTLSLQEVRRIDYAKSKISHQGIRCGSSIRFSTPSYPSLKEAIVVSVILDNEDPYLIVNMAPRKKVRVDLCDILVLRSY
jgi:hypothetical protein